MYDSKMVGFRWNLETRLYEFCFYWHDKNKVPHIENSIITSKDKIQIRMLTESKELMLSIVGVDSWDQHNTFYTYSGEMLYLINTFWGGTLPMEQTLFFGMEKLK